MVALSTILCACDLLAAPIYLLLTALVLASALSPVLRDLSSHGKTRSNVIISHSNNERAVGGFNGSTFFHRVCRYATSNELFLVDKQLFLHFYVFGIIATATLWIIGQGGVPSQDIFVLHNVPVGLLLAHLCRRAYECIYVHAWGSGKMHIGGYFLGLLHYAFVPFVVVDSDWCCAKGGEDIDVEHQLPKMRIQMVIGALLCCYGQAQQHMHHKILARLRKSSEKTSHYSIPMGLWFNYVSCPHYFAEMLIYAAFVIMLNPLGGNTSIPPCDILESANLQVLLTSILWLRSCKHLVLFVWVTTNLTMSARTSHTWYLSRFGSKYPRHRKAIVPLIY